MTIHPVLTMSESNEWYTPKPYIGAAREVMGRIDCDPASDEFAQQTVQAKVFYTPENSGFKHRWHGKVWLNPPYGRGDAHKANQSMWAQRLIEQYQAGITEEAILLVNSKTGDKWFQPLKNYPICFPDHRIDFYTREGVSTASPMSSAFIYFGANIGKFIEVFSKFGPVMGRLDKPVFRTLWEVPA